MFVDGSVSRRTATRVPDARSAGLSIHVRHRRSIADMLTPYGAELRVLRGHPLPEQSRLRSTRSSTGASESVEFARAECSVRGSSRCANITDARFETPRQATVGMTVVNQMKALISEVMPLAPIDVDHDRPLTITTAATWDRERDEALDNLAASIGCQWYAGPDGHFHIDPLPANNGEPADWIVDAGDIGVLITRTEQLGPGRDLQRRWWSTGNRRTARCRSTAWPVTPTRPLRCVGAGRSARCPRFFSSQFITTTAQANAVALDMLADNIAGTQGCGDHLRAQPEADRHSTSCWSTAACSRASTGCTSSIPSRCRSAGQIR